MNPTQEVTKASVRKTGKHLKAVKIKLYSIAKRLVYVMLGAIIGISYYIAYTEHKQVMQSLVTIQTAEASAIQSEQEQKPAEQHEGIEAIIRRVCKDEQYDNADLIVKIAKCESSLNPTAKNGTSSARGLFQILDMHKLTIAERENPEVATRWAVRKIQREGLSAWNASKNCWQK